MSTTERVPQCDTCKLFHLPLEPCIDAMKANMKTFLLRIGSVGRCSGCGATVYYVRHLNGKNPPYTEAGLNHFIDCPAAETFRKGETR